MNKKTKIVDAAQKLLQKGAYDKAIRELQKLLDEEPRDIRTLLKIGDIYAKKGDGAEATKTYRRVAEAYSEQGFFLKAVAVYKQILKHEPQNLEVSLKLAELYEHLGQMQEAMVQYQIVAAILDQGGKTREWLGVLGRMVELDPENVASRVRYAEGLSREHRGPEAIEQFASACELLEKQQRESDWVKVAERLVFHDPSRFDVLKKLAKIYLAQNDMRRAITRLEPTYKHDPRDAETLALLGRAFHGAGQTVKAVFIYKELARLHIEMGRPTDARLTYQTVLELDPSDYDAATALGASPAPRAETRDLQPRGPTRDLSPRSSVPAARSPVPRPASGGGSPKALGRVAIGSRAKRGAVTETVRRVTRPPVSTKVSKEIAKLITETDVYVKYGLREKALDHLKKVFELDPDSLEGYSKMKDIYLAAKDRARAADALAMIIRVHRRNGRDSQAETVRAELQKLVPGHPLSHRGDLDLDYMPADAIDDADIDSIDIDVADEDGGDQFGLGAPPVGPNHFDTSDLSLDDSHAHQDLDAGDILDATTARPHSIPVVRGEAAFDEGGFAHEGTDVGFEDGLPPRLSDEPLSDDAPELDPSMLFDAESSPVAEEDAPLSADFMTGAIGVAADDEPLERASQIPLPAVESSSNEAELLTLLEGGDEAMRAAALTPLPPVEVARAPELDPAEEDPSLEEDMASVDFLLEQELWEEAHESLQDILFRGPTYARALAAMERVEVAMGLRSPGRDAPGMRTSEFERTDMPMGEDEPLGAEEDEPPFVPPDSDTDVGRAPAGRSEDPTNRPSNTGYETAESTDAADAELVRGYGYQQQKLYAEAMGAYENATLVPSRAAQAWEMIGICLQEQGQTNEAVTAFYKALESGAPPDRAPRLKYEIGIACENADDKENALAWYLAAYTDDPTQPHLKARIEHLGGTAPDGNGAPPANGVHVRDEPPEGPPPTRRSKISYI